MSNKSEIEKEGSNILVYKPTKALKATVKVINTKTKPCGWAGSVTMGDKTCVVASVENETFRDFMTQLTQNAIRDICSDLGEAKEVFIKHFEETKNPRFVAEEKYNEIRYGIKK